MVSASPRAGSSRTLATRVLVVTALGIGGLVGSVHADTAQLRVGELSSEVGREEAILPALKTALTAELSKIRAPSGKRFIVSARLLKLDTKSAPRDMGEMTVSAEVSLTLRNDRDQALRAVMNGTGWVVTRRGDTSAEQAVLEAAVRGATKGVSQALGTGR